MMQEGRDFCYQFAFLHYVGELTTVYSIISLHFYSMLENLLPVYSITIYMLFYEFP